MLKIIYSSFPFINTNNNLNNIYENIILPIDDLYIYDINLPNIILNINFIKIKNYIKNNKVIPQRKKFFKVLNYYKKITDENNINNIYNKFDNEQHSFQRYKKKFNAKNILKIEDIYFDLDKQTINTKGEINFFEGGIYFSEYTFGKYHRDYDFEKLILDTKNNNNNNKNNNKNPNLICISNSRNEFWKEKLKDKKVLYISNLIQYKKLNYNNIFKNDFIIVTINFLNNSYYTNLSIDNSSDINPIFKLIKWNNFILDFSFDELKKNMNDNLLDFNCLKKWVIFNNYSQHKNNCNRIFNLFNSNISLNDIKKFIIKGKVFDIKLDLNISKEYLNFNNTERNGYNEYINNFKEIYEKQKLKFTEDEYLQKYCSYPQKKIKINKILKNLNDNGKFTKINKKYKECIQDQLNKNKNIDCKICLGDITSNNMGLTHCGHFFCFSCIYKNIKYSTTCPTCRNEISMDKIYFITDNTEKIVIDLDIFDELGTKNSTLLSKIKNYNKVLLVSNFDDCLIKIQQLLIQLNINGILTKNIENNIENNKVFLSNYNEDFLNKKIKINPDIVIFIEPYYSSDFLIKLYEINKFTNQNKFNFLILKDTIEEEYLEFSKINSICS